MNGPKLGELITTNETRDAIHIAVAAVIAGEKLWPGHEVGFINGSKDTVGTRNTEFIGIVDPFLKIPVFKGAKFWMFLLPNTITGLNHNWTHPAFEDVFTAAQLERAQDVINKLDNTSVKYIEEEAEHVELTVDELMTATDDWVRTGEYYAFGHQNENLRDPNEFFKHYQNVTNTKVDSSKHESFFTCSC